MQRHGQVLARPSDKNVRNCRGARVSVVSEVWEPASSRYGPPVDGIRLRVDRVDVRQDDNEQTLILGADGVHVMLIRLRYDGWVDEVINSRGSAAPVLAPGP